MNFSQGRSGTKVQCESCLFSQGKTPEFTQKWAKFMNFSFWPFLWFGLPGRLLILFLIFDVLCFWFSVFMLALLLCVVIFYCFVLVLFLVLLADYEKNNFACDSSVSWVLLVKGKFHSRLYVFVLFLVLRCLLPVLTMKLYCFMSVLSFFEHDQVVFLFASCGLFWLFCLEWVSLFSFLSREGKNNGLGNNKKMKSNKTYFSVGAVVFTSSDTGGTLRKCIAAENTKNSGFSTSCNNQKWPKIVNF